MKFITRLAVIRVKELSLKENGAIFCSYLNNMQSDFDMRRCFLCYVLNFDITFICLNIQVMCPTTITIYPRKKVPQTLRSTSTFLNMMLMVNPTLTMFISNEIFVQTIGVIFCRAPSVRGTRNIRKRGNARKTSNRGKA